MRTSRRPEPRLSLAALAVFLSAAASSPAPAATDAELGARQDALFERMRAEPANLELMFDYAMVSIQLEDFEPAISTLERMLIFNPDLPRVRLELGALYYRLGAYDVADSYFAEVLAGDPPPNVRERIAAFRRSIAAREEERPFSGYVSAGIVYSTNANLGPDDREVDAAILGGTGFLDPDATSDSDFGVRGAAVLRHAWDLDESGQDAWLTTAALHTLHFFEESDGDLDAFRLQTGPSLAIAEGDGAPRLRPYGDVIYVRSGNDPLYLGYGGGVDYVNPLNQHWAAFAGASAQYRDYLEGRDEFDGTSLGLAVGAAYGGIEDTVLRAALFGDVDLTDEDFTTNYELGLRGSVEHRYEPEVGFLPDAPWLASAYVQASRRWYDATDPDINPDKDRRDWDLTLGLSNAVPVAERVSLVGTARYFDRNSNVRNFELDSLEIGLDVRLTF